MHIIIEFHEQYVNHVTNHEQATNKQPRHKPRTSNEQATCLVGKQVTNYCNKNNIHILDAPVGGHRAIGLVERMI